ncbi:MAG TPA: asparagine synthase (glutamine-hydrolyzing) [Blastocatellia bacterium]|jgi:asparagine synthase (glutamine-hydrolysing)
MCGIAGIFGRDWNLSKLEAMVAIQHHRGPDAEGIYVDPEREAGLGHNRLSIIDLSEAGRQPMCDSTGRYWLVFNGELYNYLELRRQLESDYRFRTRTDSEVVLAAYRAWGGDCLDRFIGMFAFAVWDEETKTLFAARDRFGVKPLYYSYRRDGSLLIASEIKALHAAGVPAEPDPISWATYLNYGFSDHGERTFWSGINSLPPGHRLIYSEGRIRVSEWYSLEDHVSREPDGRAEQAVREEYLDLLMESIRLRFRSDVPVGINLSGGLDSSALLGLVQAVEGPESNIKAFTFVTGDPLYDELPWVRQMLARTNHPSIVCRLRPSDVPGLAESVQAHQDEPFGGLPTLAYAKLFEQARAEGVIVLLDGQGMDEQWAGYDYYQRNLKTGGSSIVQGTTEKATRAECLTPEFRSLAESFQGRQPFAESLLNLQYRDIRYTKIPKALRFNDRASMRSSIELREPFLDHRLFELALKQPRERKISNGTSKWFLRQLVRHLLPDGVVEAPKRPLQTPQREWLRGPLRGWASEQIEATLDAVGGDWLDRDAVRSAWRAYCEGAGDNSFYIWQWISINLACDVRAAVKI